MRFKIKKTTYKSGKIRYISYVKKWYGWVSLGHHIGGGGSGDVFKVADEFVYERDAINRIKRYIWKRSDEAVHEVDHTEYTKEEMREL